MLNVLDPSHEATVAGVQPATRVSSLAGKSVALISNGKEGTIGFFKHLGDLLKSEIGVARVDVHVKSNYSAPADAHIMAQIPEYDLVFSGLGD